jgi:hypothetical protein
LNSTSKGASNNITYDQKIINRNYIQCEEKEDANDAQMTVTNGTNYNVFIGYIQKSTIEDTSLGFNRKEREFLMN